MVTTVRLPEELHKKLKAEARRKGMTANALLLTILWEAVKKEEDGNGREDMDDLLLDKK